MKHLEDVSLLGVNSVRTKAYIQILCKENLRINRCLLLSTEPRKFTSELESYNSNRGENIYFDTQEPILYTLNAHDIPYEFILSDNINDDSVTQRLRVIEEQYLIYSGYGGQLIRPHLFEIGKKFLHVHAGLLPKYRGSTTIYYSMLAEASCGASAIFLTPGIDEGNVVASESFPLPPMGVDVDYIYEPYIRACVLVKALNEYSVRGHFSEKPQSAVNANTFYIIHPVLKHIALLSAKKGK